MECIKYINDLTIEIEILNDLKNSLDYNKEKLEDINDKINRKSKILEKCKSNLEKLSNNQICYRIYVKILNGVPVSKAIQEVADENYINNIKPVNAENIWRNYYPKLKNLTKSQ